MWKGTALHLHFRPIHATLVEILVRFHSSQRSWLIVKYVCSCVCTLNGIFTQINSHSLFKPSYTNKSAVMLIGLPQWKTVLWQHSVAPIAWLHTMGIRHDNVSVTDTDNCIPNCQSAIHTAVGWNSFILLPPCFLLLFWAWGIAPDNGSNLYCERGKE